MPLWLRGGCCCELPLSGRLPVHVSSELGDPLCGRYWRGITPWDVEGTEDVVHAKVRPPLRGRTYAQANVNARLCSVAPLPTSSHRPFLEPPPVHRPLPRKPSSRTDAFRASSSIIHCQRSADQQGRESSGQQGAEAAAHTYGRGGAGSADDRQPDKRKRKTRGEARQRVLPTTKFSNSSPL